MLLQVKKQDLRRYSVLVSLMFIMYFILRYARYNWLGEEWNPVKDNAVAYNIITSPFIKDATYEFKNIWNG